MAQRTQNVVEIHGYALRVIREARGRKVSDLADSLKCNRSYIAHIENGTKRTVSAAFYCALLRELQVDDYRALLAAAPARGQTVDLLDRLMKIAPVPDEVSA